MARCKPGQLAYITRDWHPDNVGRIVQVLHVDSPKWWHQLDACGPYQRIRGLAPLWVRHYNQDRTANEVLHPAGHECSHPDAWLRPINDPDIDTGEDVYATTPVPRPRINQPEETTHA